MNITHIVFSGGGILGISILGVLRYLYLENIVSNVKNIAGNSMGAYFCLLFSLKIPIQDIESILYNYIGNYDYMNINDITLTDFFNKKGVDNFSSYIDLIKNYLKDKDENFKGDITFSELSKIYGINLYISTTNINKCENFIFSIDSTPDISIFDATIASMNIPIIGTAINIDGEYYVDGALTNNFPVNIFNNIHKDLILCVIIKPDETDDYTKIIPKNTELSFLNYNYQIIKILLNNTYKQSFTSLIDHKKNNILIISKFHDIEYLPITFNKNNINKKVSKQDLDNLILTGFIQANAYFNK
jgi:predicted acylesterase/phospholipase RssA